MPRSHGRYPYLPFTAPVSWTWPGGKRLAIYVALNLEAYGFDEGMTEQLVPSKARPDVMNFSWRDYGNRVGAWRLLETFRELDLPVTLLVNSAVYAEAPGLIEAYRAAGAAIAAHGRTNAESQAGRALDDERALIAESTRVIAAHEGQPPRGWLGPWIAETAHTPELLVEAGYRYVLDWAMDDRPVWLSTGNGPLLALPYSQELNDSNMIIARRESAAAFADAIVDQLEEMLAHPGPPVVLSVALHAYITGQPFRLYRLRRALARLAAARKAAWVTTTDAIAAHVAAQGAPAPS
ncbi:MAG: polysaccharide deacetylase [Alphaproteobacteria bacterium]|nr:polysaccharide deacetylase [Alphaproteobacteria bacterium]